MVVHKAKAVYKVTPLRQCSIDQIQFRLTPEASTRSLLVMPLYRLRSLRFIINRLAFVWYSA